MLYEDITDKILASAVAVHKAIGPGLAESSYHAAMAIAMTDQGLRVGLLINFNVEALGFGIKRIVK